MGGGIAPGLCGGTSQGAPGGIGREAPKGRDLEALRDTGMGRTTRDGEETRPTRHGAGLAPMAMRGEAHERHGRILGQCAAIVGHRRSCGRRLQLRGGESGHWSEKAPNEATSNETSTEE